MNKRELSNLSNIEKEIEILEEKIRQEQVEVKDAVSGSNSEYPYTRQSIVISGIAESSKYIKKLKELKELRIKEKNKIMDYIASVNDPFVRSILMIKYNDDKHITWKEVSCRIYGRPDKGDALRMKIERHFEKSKKI